jgi:hypothetical protein
MEPDSDAARVAELEARVAALEASLERRSHELRQQQRWLCPKDLMNLSLVAAGRPPLPRQIDDLLLWRETTELTPAEVDDALERLWKSLAAGATDLDAPPA